MFSRAKSSNSSFRASSSKLSVCAECSASQPQWASITLGVLLCTQCASLHVALGSRISLVRFLADDHDKEQIALARALAAAGANAIWEYGIINNVANESHLRKPTPADSLHPSKSAFVRAKYVERRFVLRNNEDSVQDLSRQLHACVRTANLETSLRLLAQGADPNFYYADKMSTPIQVAAKAGQAHQVELLLVYGADPNMVGGEDAKKASEMAGAEGHVRLSERLVRSQYDLSDRLSHFLVGKTPSHAAGTQHFLVPTLEELGLQQNDEKKVARRRLQGLSNAVFEEIAVDVYDEIHRRHTDQIWRRVSESSGMSTAATSSSAKQHAVIPFLVVEPEYGTTRNQARQKLARLEPNEFNFLVLDVLKEIKRRSSEGLRVNSLDSCSSPIKDMANNTLRAQTKSLPLNYQSEENDQSEPIYDYVASDDDYAHIPDNSEASKPSQQSTDKPCNQPSATAATTTTKIATTSNLVTPESRVATSDEVESLRVQLASSEQRVQRLFESNTDMRAEIARLASAVNRLCSENQELRHSIASSKTPKVANNVMSRANLANDETLSPMIVNAVTANSEPPRNVSGPTMRAGAKQDLYATPESRRLTPSSSSGSSSTSSSEYPSQEEVVRRTEAITRCIQELLISAKDERLEAFIPCSERIVRAVGDMLLLFPKHNSNNVNNNQHQTSLVSQALNELTGAAANFESECRMLILRSNNEQVVNQQGFVTQQVIQCAFDIAKSTKQLVALFQ